MSPQELRATVLPSPSWGRKGYRTQDVDAFLARAADALDVVARGGRPDLTADEVHATVFRREPFGRGRGYEEGAVDDLLDRIEVALRRPAGETG